MIVSSFLHMAANALSQAAGPVKSVVFEEGDIVVFIAVRPFPYC